MTINKALEHFEWKLKNSWKPTERDVEAYNTIVEYKETQSSIDLNENELLAKLWIHQLMLLNTTKLYSAERAIQAIDEILSKPVYDWVLCLKQQSNLMRFNTVLYDEEYIKALSDLNITKIQENGLRLINEGSIELNNALDSETTDENIIKFVESQINRILNKFK